MLNTHNVIINFGKHAGTPWTRLPISYLHWLANEASGEAKELAESELARRGTTIPTTVQLSGHAIDRASQITSVWKRDGVHSWLQRRAEAALEHGKKAELGDVPNEVIFYKGLKFVFTFGEYYPTLKTVMIDKHAKQYEDL